MSYLFYPLDKPEAALYNNSLSLLTELCNNLYIYLSADWMLFILTLNYYAAFL